MSLTTTSPLMKTDRESGAPRVLPAGATVVSLFEQQAAATPDRIASVCGPETLSYAQLDALSDSLARRLYARGVRRGHLVAVSLDRTLQRIVGLLGILKSGAAYVPLDPDYPGERLEFMLHDSQSQLLLTESQFAERYRKSSIETLLIDRLDLPTDELSPKEWPDSAGPENLCYVIYTSGSTGRPKGVAVPHRAVVHLVWRPVFIDFATTDCFLHHTAMSFDPSVVELWTPLVNGGRLAIYPPGRVSLTGLGRVIQSSGVSILQLVTPLFHAMVDECLDDLQPLKALISGGEAFSIQHVRRAVDALPGTHLSLCYGPTENSVITTWYCPSSSRDLDGCSRVPLGRALEGTRIDILDSDLRPTPRGEVGELYCGGRGLADGYLHRPELTAVRFVELTLPDGSRTRAYRTGDLVRVRDTEWLEFVGREDLQVKIRSFRVELGEIEAALLTHPGIRQCAVIPKTGPAQPQGLEAWVVLAPTATVSRQELDCHLSQTLPKFMIPDRYLPIDRLPVTPTGKVDRIALQSATIPLPQAL
jgi:amino acid adenylation domain-containing protein